jgi:TRAP-type uncharacterized transport system substrate-binding protein
VLIRDKTDLSKGVIYCALVLPDSAYLAYTGQHERFKDNPAPIAILWAMYPNYLHIVTTTDSGIKSLLDLQTPTPTQITPTPGAQTPTATSPTPTPTPGPAKWSIIIGTGGVGGVYFYYGGTVAGIITNFTGIEATSIQTAASIDNLVLIRDKTDLSKGVIYCATVLPDSAYLAYTGQHERLGAREWP